MDAWTRDNERRLSEMRRRKPHPPSIVSLAADGCGDLGSADAAPPDRLHLEITYPTGATAAWFDDLWWIGALERWKQHPLSVHVLPTLHALLHPVTLHHLEMLRRVAARWRRVGHAYLDDVYLDDDVARLAAAPYDEVSIIDGFRPNTGKAPAEMRGLSFQALVGRVMRLQGAMKVERPVLVREPPSVSQASAARETEGVYAPL